MAKLFCICVMLTTMVVGMSASAIPMWEFLSRSEKMSHLFNTFVKQVADYCATSTMPDCNKVLLVYGLTNLAKMDDESMDKMDPYQRGANDIIWESMMRGSYKTSSAPKNSERDYYADALEPSTDENHLGADSNKVEEIADSSRYMMGPMVVRLLPDGSPVPGDNNPPPRDEDVEEHLAMRAQPVPSVSEIMSRKNSKRASTERTFSFNSAYLIPSESREIHYNADALIPDDASTERTVHFNAAGKIPSESRGNSESTSTQRTLSFNSEDLIPSK